jgi:hypothetical protein
LLYTIHMIKRARLAGVILAVIGLVAIEVASVNAQGASSNFRIDESFIGPGGNLESNSTNYQLDPGQSSVGNSGGVGESSSTNHTAQAGSTTTADPRLSCSVNTSSLNFGALSTSATVSSTATFSVLNYTSYGYNVSLIGSPPSNGSHALDALSSNSASIIGTEQFGLNLKDNATPNIGTEPVQVPSSTFSFGGPTSNYGTADSFRYVAGEAVATAPKSSGQTDYTVSYIINTAVTTPGGKYSGNQALLCTGTY